MRKPSFGVVTGVITILAILAFISKLVVELIPAEPENRLADEPHVFLKQAGQQQIDWMPLSEQAFAEARKANKPVMLVVGSPCSPRGRAADSVTFNTKEIQGYLDRNFISVRVDGMARPEYMNAFLPISRALETDGVRLAIPPDLQVWFLDPKGRLFGYVAQTSVNSPLDPRGFMEVLRTTIHRFELLHEKPDRAGEQQSLDQQAIRTAVNDRGPNLAGFAEYLGAYSERRVGGFPTNGFQRLWPLAWRYQLLAGRIEEYAHSISPCLTSPQVDLLDGGFFTNPARPDWRGGGFDKLAVTNAAMLQTLALGATLMNDEEQRWLALRTFDSLLGEFVHDGFVAGGRIGDESSTGRSARSSFSPRTLRERFPEDDDREWVREMLGLKVETNPEMTPCLTKLDLPATDPSRFDEVMAVLRADRPDSKFVGLGQMDVGGYTAARMMEAARILGDDERRTRSERLFERLETMRGMNDVVHSLSEADEQYSYLGDYLAYADGALQYFLATGKDEAFENGLAVLRRGLFLFGGDVKGLFTLSQPAVSALGPQDFASPEIVDNVRESCSAQIIRLCGDYGRLLGKAGTDLRAVAQDTVARFAPFSAGLGHFASGYFGAALAYQKGTFAIVVGPNSLQESQRLSRMAPTCLVAPASGRIKPPSSQTGVYVIKGVTFDGPLSVEKAAELMRVR